MRTLDKQMLEAALRYARKGLPVFPVHYPTESGCSCGKKSCSDIGKHPAVPGEKSGGLHHATEDEKTIRSWFGRSRKGYNIAAVCGMGYICLDVDPKNDGKESFEELIRDYEPLPDTWVEETGEDKEGNRGLHYWFTVPQGMTLKSRKPIPGYRGVDLLCSNVYAVVAPSLHHSGVQYDTITSVDDVVEAPEWLLNLTSEEEEEDVFFKGKSLAEPTGLRPGQDVRKFLRKGRVPPGQQRAMACKAARALWGIWVEAEDAADLIWKALNDCDWEDDPWTENQVLKLVQDEYSKQPKALDIPTGVPLATDLGRAYRLRSFARGNLAFSEDTQDWYTWDSTAWRRNGGSAPKRMIEEMALREYQEGLLREDKEGGLDKRKEAMRIQNLSNVRSMLGMTEFLEGILVEDKQFDRDPFLLNAINCVVDLRTGEALEQERDYYMTRTCRASYYEDAESDLWEEIVDDACQGNEALIDFLQLAFGYAATGDTREDTFFYMYGPGGTGKTTVLEAVSWVLGGYSAAADPETFMLQNVGQSHRADLAALRHARLVTSTEIARGSRFSTSVLNRLTGRDTIAARVPFAKAPLVFKPQWTLFFAANHFPAVPGATKRDGFWRRVKILPFENTLPREKMNPALGYKLSQEDHAAAILKWVVDGAVRWWSEYGSKNKTMDVPEVVSHEVEEIQEQEDPLSDFVEQLVIEKGAVTPRSDVYDFYRGWCDRKGLKNMHPRSFTPQLRSSLEGEDVEEDWATVDGSNQRCWLGVRLPVRTKGKMRI